MSTPIDFQAIKREVTIIQILEHYGLMDHLRQNGDKITGICPIDDHAGNIAFRANPSTNCWYCLSPCGCSGDIIDFVSRKEKVSPQKAATLMIRWFKLPRKPAVARAEAKPTSHEPATPVSPAPRPSQLSEARFPASTGSMRFIVHRYWSVCDSVEVNANSPNEAIDVAHALPLDNSKAEYVPNSMNSDPTDDVHATDGGAR